MSDLQNQRIHRIQQLLTQSLEPRMLEITDDSPAHVGHTGHQGAGHFTVQIASTHFTDKSEVECHRMIYEAVKEMMHQEIHALSIEVVR